MDEQENVVSFFRFEDLRIYAKALDYIKWLHGVISHFPEQFTTSTGNHFLRSAQNIALNIAEGSARNKAQFIYYLKMAKSSVRECVVYTEIISGVDLIDEQEKDYSRNQLMELTKMIGSLVASLQKTIPNIRIEEVDDLDDL
ncbi:MAG: four helix bundle protein [Bacteroidales bacterium]|jgi:four helix bundle protein|nr:four helix bundle protein [Bacteroidales bacterium]